MELSIKNITMAILAVIFTATIFFRVSAQTVYSEAGISGSLADGKNIAANVGSGLEASHSAEIAMPPRDQVVPSWLLVIFALLAIAFGMLITINLLRK